MTEPRFHPAARIELLEAIVEHEAARGGYGARLAAEVEATVAQIAGHPESGPRLPGYPEELDVRAFRVRTFRYALIVATVIKSGWSTQWRTNIVVRATGGTA